MASQPSDAIRRATNSRSWDNPADDSWDDDDAQERMTSLFEGGVSRYLEPVFIYKKWLLGWLAFSALLGWIALLAWPRSYESECKLQYNIGRESIGLDPTTTTTQTLTMQKSQEEDVNSAVELLRSRELAEMVVDEIGVESILSGHLATPEGKSTPTLFKSLTSSIINFGSGLAASVLNQSGVRDPVSDRERAISKIISMTEIHAAKKSSTIILHAEAKSPQMAQAIVQTLTTHFLEKHVNVSTTVGSLDFFVSQASEAEARLKDLQERRSRMLQTQQIASTESKQIALTNQLASIESTILSTQAQLKRTESEIEDISSKMNSQEVEVVASKLTDPGISGMRSQLYIAELEEKRRAALYTDNHPLLVQIREQVSASRDVLDQLKMESGAKNTTPNPLRMKLEEELLRAKTASVGLNALLQESLTQKIDKEREIRELLDFEVELSEVSRELDVARISLVSLRDKQEQARVVDSLKNKHISSIAISQPASLIEKPVHPKKTLIIAAFLFLGFGGGVGLIALREATRTTIRHAEEAERILGYPVLANIPENGLLKRHSVTSKKRTYKTLRSKNMKNVHEGCRSIMSELFWGDGSKEQPEIALGRKIGIVGVRDGCGASSIAMILAIESSENEGLRTALVDLDLHKRTVSHVFGLMGPPRNASSELIVDKCDPSDFMQFTCDTLDIVGISNSKRLSEHFDVRDITLMLEKLSESNDFVFVDLPCANRPNRTLSIAQHVDQVVIVIESDVTTQAEVKRLCRQLEKGGVQILGLVVNKHIDHLPALVRSIVS